MKEKILEWCRTLAASQGFYGRLLEEFEEHPEKLEKVAIQEQENSIMQKKCNQ